MFKTCLPGDFTKQKDEGKREIEVTDSDIQGEIAGYVQFGTCKYRY